MSASGRTTCSGRANHTSGGILPWGMDPSCVTNPTYGFDGFDDAMPEDTQSDEPAALAGLGPSRDIGVLDLVGALSDAAATFESGLGFHTPDWEAYRNARGANDPGGATCDGCHAEDPSNPPTPSIRGRPCCPRRSRRCPISGCSR